MSGFFSVIGPFFEAHSQTTSLPQKVHLFPLQYKLFLFHPSNYKALVPFPLQFLRAELPCWKAFHPFPFSTPLQPLPCFSALSPFLFFRSLRASLSFDFPLSRPSREFFTPKGSHLLTSTLLRYPPFPLKVPPLDPRSQPLFFPPPLFLVRGFHLPAQGFDFLLLDIET